jgi:hypothetical protein
VAVRKIGSGAAVMIGGANFGRGGGVAGGLIGFGCVMASAGALPPKGGTTYGGGAVATFSRMADLAARSWALMANSSCSALVRRKRRSSSTRWSSVLSEFSCERLESSFMPSTVSSKADEVLID